MLPLKIRPLTADFGAAVHDLDLINTDENLSAAILDQLDESALLLFRRQSLHDEDLLRLSQALGPVEEPAAKAQHAPGFKEINYISNLQDESGRPIGGANPGAETPWHSDQAFRVRPATLSTLFCVQPALAGGATSFASTRLGYETLPAAMKARIAGLRGTYSPGPMHEVESGEVLHPLVLEHPIRDRRTLYVSPLTKAVEGLSAVEGRALLEELLGCVLKPEHQYRHNWRMGDLLIYDNAQLLHRRDAFAGLRWLKATRVFVSPQHFAVPD